LRGEDDWSAAGPRERAREARSRKPAPAHRVRRPGVPEPLHREPVSGWGVRADFQHAPADPGADRAAASPRPRRGPLLIRSHAPTDAGARGLLIGSVTVQDRKSTRLNSSHDQISYAVFCLKKKMDNSHSAFVY